MRSIRLDVRGLENFNLPSVLFRSPRQDSGAKLDARPEARMDAESFGNRAQVKILEKRLAHAMTANGPGGGEVSGDITSTMPLFAAAKAALAVGLSRADEDEKIGRFLGEIEKQSPITKIAKPSHVSVSDWNVFRAEKGIACLAFGRDPHEVTEKMVRATSTRSTRRSASSCSRVSSGSRSPRYQGRNETLARLGPLAL